MSALNRAVIVNADDFGRSPGVNRGVAIAHERGVVTSASLMVRRPAAGEAAAYAKRNPRLSIGLHVDLGEWIYRDGRWEPVDIVAGSPADEIGRQLARFRELVGSDPTHVDSHQNVHREPPVKEMLTNLAGELGIPLRGFDQRIRYCGDFYGQTATGDPLPRAIDVDALVELLGQLPPGTTELGCHPGVGTDGDLPYGVERSIEVQTLCDSRVRAALVQHDIELRSFAEPTVRSAETNGQRRNKGGNG